MSVKSVLMDIFHLNSRSWALSTRWTNGLPGCSHRKFFFRTPVLVVRNYRTQSNAIGTFQNNVAWDIPESRYAAGLVLGLRPANERRCYKVTPSLIGWAQTWNQPYAVRAARRDNFTDVSFFLFDYFLEPIQPWRMCYDCHYAVSDGRTKGVECNDPFNEEDPRNYRNAINCTGHCTVSTEPVEQTHEPNLFYCTRRKIVLGVCAPRQILLTCHISEKLRTCDQYYF